ncbi:MAG: triose-phosphate isomerase [Nitrospira sp.]|nr:triose-phosphate isomerase [Nitrospira sp.]MCC7473004.1 triose-phosphate isomerase [Candidatus Nomurabacteria bacterium]
MRTRFIVGNWKMNKTATEAVAFVHRLNQELPSLEHIQVGFTPPFTALHATRDALGSTPAFLLGAQNLYWEDKGAFTGEVSGPMLKDLGCEFVLVGHSERRQYFGDQDTWTNQKVLAAIRHGLHPILCVGETLQERDAEQTNLVIERQLRAGLVGVDGPGLATLTIAYEPVWAIGTGRAATAQQAVPVHRMIRRIIGELGGAHLAKEMRILYGGSVTPHNIADFLSSEEIDGALVGGACLDPISFATLIKVAIGSKPTTTS